MDKSTLQYFKTIAIAILIFISIGAANAALEFRTKKSLAAGNPNFTGNYICSSEKDLVLIYDKNTYRRVGFITSQAIGGIATNLIAPFDDCIINNNTLYLISDNETISVFDVSNFSDIKETQVLQHDSSDSDPFIVSPSILRSNSTHLLVTGGPTRIIASYDIRNKNQVTLADTVDIGRATSVFDLMFLDEDTFVVVTHGVRKFIIYNIATDGTFQYVTELGDPAASYKLSYYNPTQFISHNEDTVSLYTFDGGSIVKLKDSRLNFVCDSSESLRAIHQVSFSNNLLAVNMGPEDFNKNNCVALYDVNVNFDLTLNGSVQRLNGFKDMAFSNNNEIVVLGNTNNLSPGRTSNDAYLFAFGPDNSSSNNDEENSEDDENSEDEENPDDSQNDPVATPSISATLSSPSIDNPVTVGRKKKKRKVTFNFNLTRENLQNFSCSVSSSVSNKTKSTILGFGSANGRGTYSVRLPVSKRAFRSIKQAGNSGLESTVSLNCRQDNYSISETFNFRARARRR